MKKILIAGGEADPNLHWIRSIAGRLGMETQCALVQEDVVPSFHWNIGTGAALLNGQAVDCDAAFIRYDVFSTLKNPSAETAANATAWYSALSSYCHASEIFVLNREIASSTASKPAMLLEARKHGLRIPETIASNILSSFGELDEGSAMIAKPIAGGSYVMDLFQAVSLANWTGGLSPSPALVQPLLRYPEVRIYRVGQAYYAFDIRSTTTDSRLDRGSSIVGLTLDGPLCDIVSKIENLTDSLSCDFCAIDLKSDAQTGELVFLELNNSPMFVGYDKTIGGVMTEQMISYLSKGRGS